MKKLWIGATIFGLAAFSYAGVLAWRAHKDIVTLHVRNAPIEQVVASLRWQTWEKFIVGTNVQGTVTLDVDRMPLGEVLGILSEQLNARWTAIYPVYREKSSLVSLERALRGEVKLADTKFTNFQARAMGPGGEPTRQAAQPVTLHLDNTDLPTTALALERFGGGQVLIEKDAQAKLTLDLQNTSFDKAVSQIARAARRSSTKLYALQAGMRPGNMARVPGPDRPRGGERREPGAEAQTERLEKMQQVLQVLPEDVRLRSEEREAERLAMQSLTPAQRQQAMAERMNSPEMQARSEQRSVSGIKNTTPEQRRERYERMYQMRKARAASTPRNG